MCPTLRPPPYPVMPTPSQVPTAWVVILFVIVTCLYIIWQSRIIVRGRSRSLVVLNSLLIFVSVLIGSITLDMYSTSWLVITRWHQQLLEQPTSPQCPVSAVEAAYSHVLADIEPLHIVYRSALACVTGLFIVFVVYILHLAKHGHIATLRR